MLDRVALKVFKPAIDAAAHRAMKAGLCADQITYSSLGFGLAAAALIAFGFTWLALIPLLIGRLLDAVDGALARLTMQTDRGAFLDIGLDFIFYAAIPLSFAWMDPAANALAAATLLAAFVATGTTFLAFAVIAEKRGIKSTAYPSKSFYYLGGLTEGTETIACFCLMCLWPQYFPAFAYIYAAMCGVTTVTRLAAGRRVFSEPNS